MIHRLVKHLFPGDDPEAQQESLAFDYTLNEAEEMIQGLKQLVQCSDYAEQIRLLTLAPRSWDRDKVEAFFNCSERQARNGVHLRDSGRVLHRPVELRGNLSFDPQVEKKIFKYHHDDLISRVRMKHPSVFFSNCIGPTRSHRIKMTCWKELLVENQYDICWWRYTRRTSSFCKRSQTCVLANQNSVRWDRNGLRLLLPMMDAHVYTIKTQHSLSSHGIASIVAHLIWKDWLMK